MKKRCGVVIVVDNNAAVSEIGRKRIEAWTVKLDLHR
tara:strand:+ start:2277 stop:2387 length:111 start_codon:yes stop_codon:yes gene_type:complete